jgi:hypothetical protein
MEELAGDVVLQQAFAILVNVVGSKLATNVSMSRNQRKQQVVVELLAEQALAAHGVQRHE